MDIQYTQNTLFVHFLLLDTMLLAEINRIFLQKESLISPLSYVCKGHLISKWFFGVFDFFKKLNENKSTWGIIVVKSNSFVHFLTTWKNHFDFIWPLVHMYNFEPKKSTHHLKTNFVKIPHRDHSKDYHLCLGLYLWLQECLKCLIPEKKNWMSWKELLPATRKNWTQSPQIIR